MMGYKTRASVRKWLTGSSNSKSVLLVLAEYADDSSRGNANPSVKTISVETEICEKSVRMALKNLMDNGFIIATYKRHGARSTFAIPYENPGIRYRTQNENPGIRYRSNPGTRYRTQNKSAVLDTAEVRYEIPTIIKNHKENKELFEEVTDSGMTQVMEKPAFDIKKVKWLTSEELGPIPDDEMSQLPEHLR